MKSLIERASATAAVLTAAPWALAAEAEPAGEPSIFAGNLGNAIWTVVIFLVLLWVLRRFAWGPILRNLKGREDFIRDSIEQARKERRDAQALLDQYQAQLARAREEAAGIIAEGRQQAQAVKNEVIQQTKAETDQMIQRARQEIDAARDSAVQDVYDRTAELATEVAGKIIARQLNPEDHRELIRQTLEQMSRSGSN